jgi:hypothetical protein
MWAVIGPALSDGVRDPEPETQEDECVEPVLPETPEPLHVLKVLRFRADRLGREDESQILRGDDVKSASRPKTSGAGEP